MATKMQAAARAFVKSAKKRRPGVHAKSKTSSLKTSKHYVKAYRGQGK